MHEDRRFARCSTDGILVHEVKWLIFRGEWQMDVIIWTPEHGIRLGMLDFKESIVSILGLAHGDSYRLKPDSGVRDEVIPLGTGVL
jgi:hypothetical protein